MKQKFIDIRRINLNTEYYKPKMNQTKRFGFLAFIGLCLITPCTNWMIAVIPLIVNKFDPLWFYK